MAQRAAERSDEPHKQLAHRSSHTPIHHLPQHPFWGTPWRMPRHTPELLSSSVSEALRRAGACLRPLSSLRPLAQWNPKTHRSMPPRTASPAWRCLTREMPVSGCWREPPPACRPGGGDGAEWEALWAAQPELRRRRGRQGREQRLELRGLLPSTAQDLGPGPMAWSGQPSSRARLAGRGPQGCGTSGCGTLRGAAPRGASVSYCV